MNVEIVSTGTELLLGQIVNSTAAYLAKELNRLGLFVIYQSTVGDNPARMREVITAALNRADVVVTTGGLGPTLGDITKQAVADVLGKKMAFDAASADVIRGYFCGRGLNMPERNLRQAYFPEGTEVVPNKYGTAPCVYLRCRFAGVEKLVIQLPGPPRELSGVFGDEVEWRIRRDFGQQKFVLSRVLKCHGIGESALEELLHDYVAGQSNPTIALLAKDSELHVRITAQASSETDATAMLDELHAAIDSRAGQFVFAVDDEDIRVVLHELFLQKKLTLATAESCTGGLLGAEFNLLPGSSEYYLGGVIAYSNLVKRQLLDISARDLDEFGAVSGQVAAAMARNVRIKMNADIGLSTTGIAGPAGGSEAKPVGLVYIAISDESGERITKLNLSGNRELIKIRAIKTLQMKLKKHLEGANG